MCTAITTDVSVGTALNIPLWTLCIFSALISLTAGVSRLNYPDMDEGSKNGKLGGHSLLMEFLICVILGYITTTSIYYETTVMPIQECLDENNRRHRKRSGERVTKSQMKLSRRTEQKHIALEGKPLEEGSMPSSVVMTMEAGQMSGLLLVSANRQTGGTIVTRGHVFWRGCPVRKTGPSMVWHWPRLPVFPGLPFYPSPSIAGNRHSEASGPFIQWGLNIFFFFFKSVNVCQSHTTKITHCFYFLTWQALIHGHELTEWDWNLRKTNYSGI